MSSYTDFASVYDTLMDQTPYDSWCEFITKALRYFGIEEGLVLDLGCGTGNMTERLADRGYDMIGVDYADQMLAVAMEKKRNSNHDILYLLQDMREFELYGTVRAVVSVCDSINYLLEEEELVTTFSLVNNYLDPKGIFIFDFNTVYKYGEVIGNTTIAENREDCSFIWENYYYPKEEVNEYDLTIFIKEEENRYQKFHENHYQRGYELTTIQEALEKAGMEFLGAVDEQTKGPVKKDSERIYCFARERGKKECQII